MEKLLEYHSNNILEEFEKALKKKEETKEEAEDEAEDEAEKKFILEAKGPFVCILGPRHSRRHQFSIEILEARDLKPSIVGRLDDTYCKIYLKLKRRQQLKNIKDNMQIPSSSSSSSSTPSATKHQAQQPQYTYVCEQVYVIPL